VLGGTPRATRREEEVDDFVVDTLAGDECRFHAGEQVGNREREREREREGEREREREGEKSSLVR
jgi:hypothetical protein